MLKKIFILISILFLVSCESGFLVSCESGSTDTNNDTLSLQNNIINKEKIDSFVLSERVIYKTDSVSLEIIDYGLIVQSHEEVSYFLKELNDFRLEACFETSLTIHGEGPHCDLIDWKHGYTPWKNITNDVDVTNCHFEIPEIPETIRTTFPDVAFAEIKEKFRQHCGEAWYKLISKSKSIENTPVEVTVSRVIFRVTGARKDNGIQTTRIFSMYIPMGC